MVVVAVAGGSGGLGRTLVEGIQARGTHEVVVLSRKVSSILNSFLPSFLHDTNQFQQANPTLEAERGVRFVAIDYSDVEAAAKVLEENNIHTIISAVTYMPGAGENHEDRLVKAADLSSTTKRFIPSNWTAKLHDK